MKPITIPRLKNFVKRKLGLAPTYQSSLEKIINIPKKYNVNKIQLNNECLWPYIRNDLTVALTGQFDYIKRNVKFTPYLSQKGHTDNLPIEDRAEYKHLYGCIDIDELDEYKDIDYLFVTNLTSGEDVKIDETIYKRLTDPLYEASLKSGKSLKIEIVKFKTKNISNVQKYYHPTVAILPPVDYKENDVNGLVLDDEFIKILQKYCRPLPITKKFIKELINWNLHSKDYWLKILKKINPKVVLTTGFHRAGPMISAAQELGIKSVDIQHGVQSGWNPIYNHWEEIPSKGYPSLPDVFAVWSKEDKEHISKVFKPSNYSGLQLGYPWLSRQNDFVTHKILNDLLVRINNYDTVVLLTMQREKVVSKVLKKLIKSNQQILWIVRSHPKGRKFKLNDFGALNNIYTSTEVNEMYISKLVEYIDFHVTEGSTMIKEVAYFNVPSVLVKRKNLSYFKNEISKKIAYKAFSLRQFKKVINILKKNSFKIKTSTDCIDIEKSLESLLQKK